MCWQNEAGLVVCVRKWVETISKSHPGEHMCRKPRKPQHVWLLYSSMGFRSIFSLSTPWSIQACSRIWMRKAEPVSAFHLNILTARLWKIGSMFTRENLELSQWIKRNRYKSHSLAKLWIRRNRGVQAQRCWKPSSSTLEMASTTCRPVAGLPLWRYTAGYSQPCDPNSSNISRKCWKVTFCTGCPKNVGKRKRALSPMMVLGIFLSKFKWKNVWNHIKSWPTTKK